MNDNELIKKINKSIIEINFQKKEITKSLEILKIRMPNLTKKNLKNTLKCLKNLCETEI